MAGLRTGPVVAARRLAAYKRDTAPAQIDADVANAVKVHQDHGPDSTEFKELRSVVPGRGPRDISGWQSQVRRGGRGLSPRDLHHPPTNLG